MKGVQNYGESRVQSATLEKYDFLGVVDTYDTVLWVSLRLHMRD